MLMEARRKARLCAGEFERERVQGAHVAAVRVEVVLTVANDCQADIKRLRALGLKRFSSLPHAV